ncbi:TetR family transcriptional regulator [bacterium]|nr:TetR family transcriptional regulator [bacterium]
MTKKELNEKEQKLKNAAKKLFLEKGFNETTSRDIAKEA